MNKIVFMISGIWRPAKNNPFSLRFFYYCYCTILHSLGAFFFVCEVLQFSETFKSPRKFVAHIGMLGTHLMGTLKLGILIFSSNNIANVMSQLQDTTYYYRPFGKHIPGEMVMKEKKMTSLVVISVFVLYSFVGISAHLSSVSTLEEEVTTYYFGTNQSCYDYLRYYFYIPFSTQTKRKCYLALTFMDLGLGYFAWIIACYDGLFVGLLDCLKVHLTILALVFKTSGTEEAHKNNRRIFLRKIPISVDERLNRHLTDSIQHFQMLLKVRDDIESITYLASLGQALASLLVLASTLYAASTVPANSPEFFAQIEYLGCLLLQLFLLCWYGNGITSACDQMRLYLYECYWYNKCRNFKYKFKITLMRLQKPVFITIGKFSPLNLSTFLTVCKGSFSYYTLFKSLKS